jgi:Protein of unknown function (DUF5131)
VRFLSIEPLLEDLGRLQLRGIHWVIVGGESGRSARPMKREWVVSIRDQCVAADVPFFFKQWGGFHKKRAGRKLDGKTYNDFPQLSPKTQKSHARRQRFHSVGSRDRTKVRHINAGCHDRRSCSRLTSFGLT